LLERSGDYRGALAHLWRHVELRTELDRQNLPSRVGMFAAGAGVGDGSPDTTPGTPTAFKSPSSL
jgi:hypothetical protein